MLSSRFKKRPYVVVIIVFIATVVLSFLLYKTIVHNINIAPMFGRLVLKTALLIGFLSCMTILVRNWKTTFKWGYVNSKHWSLLLFMVGLFAANNIFSLIVYGNDYFKKEISVSLWLYIGVITVNSVAEEITYRGFIQEYINQHTPMRQGKVSNGNIAATVLMTIAHFGFFTVMKPLEASLAIILVIIFSIIAGYLRDSTEGVIFPILAHLACNYTHVMVNYCR